MFVCRIGKNYSDKFETLLLRSQTTPLLSPTLTSGHTLQKKTLSHLTGKLQLAISHTLCAFFCSVVSPFQFF